MTSEQKDLILKIEKVLDNLSDLQDQAREGKRGQEPTGFVWYRRALSDVRKGIMDIEKTL